MYWGQNAVNEPVLQSNFELKPEFLYYNRGSLVTEVQLIRVMFKMDEQIYAYLST